MTRCRVDHHPPNPSRVGVGKAALEVRSKSARSQCLLRVHPRSLARSSGRSQRQRDVGMGAPMQRRVGVRPRGHPQGSDHEESKRWRKRDSAPIPAIFTPRPFHHSPLGPERRGMVDLMPRKINNGRLSKML